MARRGHAQALFDVDDFEHFVKCQSESALRHVATRYNYDEGEDHGVHEVTLRAVRTPSRATCATELQQASSSRAVADRGGEVTTSPTRRDRRRHAAPPAAER